MLQILNRPGVGFQPVPDGLDSPLVDRDHNQVRSVVQGKISGGVITRQMQTPLPVG